ncbi:threonylcarbamoyl-AMP synthase [Candidatus Woesearchaeota archaeon]|nr:threonylcarbamoyl-AMP synthase [Candidatus Woesearchaeota archaeon]
MTLILKLAYDSQSYEGIKRCAELLKNGKLVVFPTETVYGLGANALDPEAVDSIFKAKGRPQDNPIIVHVYDRNMLNGIVEDIPNDAKKLMRKFWPGPLTFILKKKDTIPSNVTGGLDTVAVRMPSHPIARALIKESGVPVGAPSANISGRPSTTNAEQVIEELSGRVDAIIDGGDADVGLESTVIDLTGKIPILLRPGGVTKEDMEKALGKKIKVANPLAKKPRSPGMKYRHYAPDANLFLITGEDENDMMEKLVKVSKKLSKESSKIAIIGSEELADEIDGNLKCDFIKVGNRRDLSILAHNIFKTLRELDHEKYDYILIGSCPEKGIGLAIMNRLRKAATKIV